MKESYLILEDYEEYSALGETVVGRQMPLAVFSTKKKAFDYCKKYSKPQQLNGFPPLGYGHLSVTKMATDTKMPVTKLPNYKGVKDLQD